MSTPIIELQNIVQEYPTDNGKVTIIKDLNLQISDTEGRGEFNVILGPSGCGKSTVLRYIANLQRPTSGIVNIHGKPIGDKHQVGMVFQKYSSFPWLTVLENVAYGLKIQGVAKKEREDRAQEIISRVGLAGHENKYAQYPILSGGQLQRIAIARSLLASPDILLMDEPFGALDIRTRQEMQDLLNEIFYEFNPTILLVTHDIREAVYLADDILVMSNAPSYFAHKVNVDLGFKRDKSLKRSTEFISATNHIEDIMMQIEN
jgi:NitT/TauT family transport system ATP-binding protein